MAKPTTQLSRWKSLRLPALMLGPFTILVFVFFFLPVVLVFLISFTSMDFAMRWDFVGLQNFKKLFNDVNIVEITMNTAKYVFFTLLINVLFGLTLGLLTTYFVQRESVSLFFRTMWILPRSSPPVVYVLLWLWFFDPSEYGIFNSIREALGMEPTMFIINHPMTAVILANGIIGASFGMILFSSAIESIPKDLFKAARVDGAGHFAIIKDIILPAIKWQIMFVTLWQLLSLLTSYEYILLLTDGGPGIASQVLSLFSYQTAFRYFDFGYGSTISIVLVTIAIILSLILWRFFRMDEIESDTRIDD